MTNLSGENLSFGRYGQLKQLRDKYRLLIHYRINTNAERQQSGDPTWLKLKSPNASTRKLTRQFVKIQLWFFKNNTAFFTRWRSNRKKLAPVKELPGHMFK